MLVLAFDTTMASCSVAVYDAGAGKLLAALDAAMAKGHAEALAPMVQLCLKQARIGPSQLGRIAVTIGPGTFTGLRIGLSLAHGMGVALGSEVVGLDTLTATAAPVLAHHDRLLVVHAAGATGKFHAARFTAGHLDHGPAFVDLDAARALAAAPGTAVLGTAADTLKAAVPDLVRIPGHDLPQAAHFIARAAGLPKREDYPQPLYLREPDAKPAVAIEHVTTRPAGAGDLQTLSRLHGMCFAEGWSADSFAAALALPGALALVAECDGAARAFVQLRQAADEAEVITLCSEPRWRRKGLAKKLIGAARELLRARNCRRLYLEVADDNRAARGLYGKLGFTETGMRKNYYSRAAGSAVDAIVLVLVP